MGPAEGGRKRENERLRLEREILKKAAHLLGKDQRETFPVRVLCDAVGVSPAGVTEAQVIALEKAKTEKEASGEFESECQGYCGAQDIFYVGNMKGVGRIYQQTFIDT